MEYFSSEIYIFDNLLKIFATVLDCTGALGMSMFRDMMPQVRIAV